MPIRSEWKLAREGITVDTVTRLLSSTLLNPALTLPLLLLARHTSRGRLLASAHSSALKALQAALALGILTKTSAWLDSRVANRWTSDVYDWKRELVVVTGGADGIGRIVVELLAERGITVAVMDVQDLTYDPPPNVHFFRTDLASKPSLDAAATAIRTQLGNPTVLINNAGLARGRSILASTESDLRLTFAVNTLSHYFLAQHFLPHMIAQDHGLVLTVASMAAYTPAPLMVDYAASKAAALAFHEGLTAELAALHRAPRVRTVVVCQGYTRTKLFEGFRDAALWPETVAEEIVRAVLRGGSGCVVLPRFAGAVAAMVRGLPYWMQWKVRDGLGGRMRDWRGRQVAQPSLEGEGEKGAGVGESAVLVGGE